jgi:hypothetical protein
MEAIADDIEKKIRGTTAVKRRFRKMSPKGLRTAALAPRIKPRVTPEAMPIRRNVMDALQSFFVDLVGMNGKLFL